MNKSRYFITVKECKIQATILLKSLHSSDLGKTKSAAKRFKILPEFTDQPLESMMHAPIKRKHALTVIAIENGFSSWSCLKMQKPFVIGGFLNKWFADYEEAKLSLQREGGFLLPYQNQFFICDANYIQQLGFDPNDLDWKLICYDWVKPNDNAAAQRLHREWSKIQEKIA